MTKLCYLKGKVNKTIATLSQRIKVIRDTNQCQTNNNHAIIKIYLVQYYDRFDFTRHRTYQNQSELFQICSHLSRRPYPRHRQLTCRVLEGVFSGRH